MSSLAPPNPTSPRKVSPNSILLPCSSLPKPSKDAAGERKLGWLAAPPKELTAPRPIAPVVSEERQPMEPLPPLPDILRPQYSPEDGESTDTVSSAVPSSSSPSPSQDSVTTSATSVTSGGSDKLPTFSALQRSGSISVADATRSNWDRKLDGQTTPRSATTPRASSSRADGPCTAIRFGALPERPPELRRRNSITLGVLARKNMLSAQGTYNPGGGTGAGGPVNKVYMTDAEWAEYQEKFAKKSGTAQPVDLGAVVSHGAKKFFGKLRRGSNTSVTSTTSNGSTTTNRGRSDSNGTPVSPKVSGGVHVEPALVEEDEPNSAPGSPKMGFTAIGEDTPRAGRSPSPIPQRVFDEDDEDDEEVSYKPRQLASSAKNDVLHQHHPSSVAALGFELDNYKGRPWERTNGQAGGAVSS